MAVTRGRRSCGSPARPAARSTVQSAFAGVCRSRFAHRLIWAASAATFCHRTARAIFRPRTVARRASGFAARARSSSAWPDARIPAQPGEPLPQGPAGRVGDEPGVGGRVGSRTRSVNRWRAPPHGALLHEVLQAVLLPPAEAEHMEQLRGRPSGQIREDGDLAPVRRLSEDRPEHPGPVTRVPFTAEEGGAQTNGFVLKDCNLAIPFPSVQHSRDGFAGQSRHTRDLLVGESYVHYHPFGGLQTVTVSEQEEEHLHSLESASLVKEMDSLPRVSQARAKNLEQFFEHLGMIHQEEAEVVL